MLLGITSLQIRSLLLCELGSMLHLNIIKKGQSIKLIGDFQLLHLLNFYLQTNLKTINLSIQHQIWNDKESKSVKRKRTYQGLFKFSKSLVNSFGPALGKGQPPHLCHVPVCCTCDLITNPLVDDCSLFH